MARLSVNTTDGRAESDKSHTDTAYVVGVIGSGVMGTQITEYLLRMKYFVLLKTRAQENIKKSKSNIQKRLLKNSNIQSVEECMGNLTVTTNYSDLSDVDIVIEASKEDLDIKKKIFLELSDICKSTTVLATNTSSLSINELSAIVNKPERFIGFHFFNPAAKMELIELVVGSKTSDETIEFARSFAKDLRKHPIVVKDSPGFVVNRLLLPQINEATRLLSQGIASKEDIDLAIKLGLNHPMGPFELADFIGVDTCLSIMEVLHNSLGDDYFEPTPLIRKMVNEGKLGYKSREGFYKY